MPRPKGITAVDIVPEKVEMLNRWESPIQDDYIEKYSEHEERYLSLKATIDAATAYADVDYVIIADSTNYDPQKIFLTRPQRKALLNLYSLHQIRRSWSSNQQSRSAIQSEFGLSTIQIESSSVRNSCGKAKRYMTH